ncbi:MAG: class I SAM-dependent methyltransferase, partial [Burkholderiales bacterium]
MASMAEQAYRERIKTAAEAEKYQRRRPARERAELKLVERAFRLIPETHRVLDIPCGAGRVTILLARLGYSVIGAELSEPMISATRENIARAGLTCSVHKEDIERMSYEDSVFDTIVCFRLFHHFPSIEVRRRVVRELCRVAGRFVALSYFDPRSLTSLKRTLRAKLGGKRSKQHATSLKEVEGYFQENGFRLVRDFAQMPVVR